MEMLRGNRYRRPQPLLSSLCNSSEIDERSTSVNKTLMVLNPFAGLLLDSQLLSYSNLPMQGYKIQGCMEGISWDRLGSFIPNHTHCMQRIFPRWAWNWLRVPWGASQPSLECKELQERLLPQPTSSHWTREILWGAWMVRWDPQGKAESLRKQLDLVVEHDLPSSICDQESTLFNESGASSWSGALGYHTNGGEPRKKVLQ